MLQNVFFLAASIGLEKCPLPYSLLLDYSTFKFTTLPYPTLPEPEKPLPVRAWARVTACALQKGKTNHELTISRKPNFTTDLKSLGSGRLIPVNSGHSLAKWPILNIQTQPLLINNSIFSSAISQQTHLLHR